VSVEQTTTTAVTEPRTTALTCDPLDERACLLPWPNDAFTVPDSSTATGRRLAIDADSTPTNVEGVHIDVTDQNRADGFSPGSAILAFVPGVDLEKSRVAASTDIGSSLDPESPVVLLDTETGQRLAYWAELDAQAPDGQQVMMVRPAVALPEGHRIVVVLRNLLDSDGNVIPATEAFRATLDNTTEPPERGADFARILADIAADGIDVNEVFLTWDFTVASAEGLSGRALAMREAAYAALGDTAPRFTVTDQTDSASTRVINGTYEVPNFLTGDGSPGNSFFYTGEGLDDLPAVNPENPTLQAPFVCNISVATMDGTEPAHLVQYGHGLLGDHHEIDAGNVRAMSNEHNVVHCATKWAGMSEDDIGNAALTLTDMGNFLTMADRLQQGVLNQIFLGRLMTRAGGLADDPNFQRADGTPLIDTGHLDYDGNSQGGIMGLMLAAVSPDIERAVLGVTGMNYSMLLPRSVDFDTYEAIMKPAYPNDLDRTLIFGIVQMLWDRGEGAGYVQHATADPYAGTPAKTLLMHVAYGDHQVTELSALIEARTIGATIHRPLTVDGRWDEKEPGWGLESTVYPSTGSAIVIWDSGMAPIPFENLPPREGDDSHEDPRADADVRVQKASFLFDDTLVDVCGGAACAADHRD